MKYVFVGDIHGKVAEVEAALAMDGRKIFVGDFIDSWDRTVEDHRKCYELVLDAVEKGEADVIFGNHELSYLVPYHRKHRCSGYDKHRAYLMLGLQDRIEKAFKPYIFLAPDFLVSHAGLTSQIWENHKLTIESLPQVLEQWWPDLGSPMHGIGYARGGGDKWGGMFWCDYNQEFEPVTGLRQVFGHTRGRGNGIRQAGNSYCIDCLDYDKNTFLELEI